MLFKNVVIYLHVQVEDIYCQRTNKEPTERALGGVKAQPCFFCRGCRLVG
jgi:hypothetical protein